jgi:hypothetical protein
MAVTKTQFRAVFGTTTDDQFDKLLEWVDAVSTNIDETDPDNPVVVPNTIETLAAHVRADLVAKYTHWKADQSDLEF